MEIPPNSKYEERIRYLLENQHLGRTSLEGNLFPNCHGTSLWVLEAASKIENYPGLVGTLVGATFPPTDGPFYAGGSMMGRFLDTYCEQIGKQPDVLFIVKDIMESLDGHDYEDYVHSGIYLGNDICFDQHDRGGEFRICSLEESVGEYSFDLSDDLEFFRTNWNQSSPLR